jgi:hypothetical protein
MHSASVADAPNERSIMQLPHRPSHGVIAGYAGLLLGTIAVAGGPAMASGLINGRDIKRGTITATKLAPNSITAAKVRDGAITSRKLATGAVTAAAVAPGAIDGSKIRDQSLGIAELSMAARAALYGGPAGAGSVTTTTIADGAVTAGKLASGAVETASVADGAITAAKLAAGAVDTSAVADGAITATKLAANSVNTLAIADGTITSAKMEDGAAGGAKIPALVTSVVGHVNNQSWAVVSLPCMPGKQALGGGVTIDDAAFPVGGVMPIPTVNAPTFGIDNIPTGWTVKVSNGHTALGAFFTVHVICA